jgi:hypothetical protein
MERGYRGARGKEGQGGRRGEDGRRLDLSTLRREGGREGEREGRTVAGWTNASFSLKGGWRGDRTTCTAYPPEGGREGGREEGRACKGFVSGDGCGGRGDGVSKMWSRGRKAPFERSS